jgi:Fur family ferric uptake transcriptional regulator
VTHVHCSTPADAIDSQVRAERAELDAAIAVLRKAGCRPTAQRLLVLRALGGGDHAGADEILARARERHPAMDPSTVYRTLDVLVEAGVARCTDLGRGRRSYEPAGPHRHHHAVCQRCGAVTHVHDAALGTLAGALRAATGFTLTPDREITIPGLCPACSEGADDAHP